MAKEINEVSPSWKRKDWVLRPNQLKGYFLISDYHFMTAKEISGRVGITVGTAHLWINIYAREGLLEASTRLVGNKGKRALAYRRKYSKVEIGISGVVWQRRGR